jgi:hypothetical protein
MQKLDYLHPSHRFLLQLPADHGGRVQRAGALDWDSGLERSMQRIRSFYKDQFFLHLLFVGCEDSADRRIVEAQELATSIWLEPCAITASAMSRSLDALPRL